MTTRRVKPAEDLIDAFARGYTTVMVAWGNRYTNPPTGIDRTLWEAVIPYGDDYASIVRDHAPPFQPGSGWALMIGCVPAPGPKWSPEAKARVRQGRLRRRLEAKWPLFADQFFEDETSRRADYFAGGNP